MMVHFAIADAAGRSVVVEYIDNEMSVVETDIATNFYLTAGEKYNFNSQFVSTEWSIVYNQQTGEIRYYLREKYYKDFSYKLDME